MNCVRNGAALVLLVFSCRVFAETIEQTTIYQACMASPSNCTVLDLDWRQLTGTVPTELATLTSLTLIHFFYNRLVGTIPSELGTITGLTEISLGGNQLTSTIPTEFGSLTHLRDMRLYTNQLTGTIPSELGALTDLTMLYVGNGSNHQLFVHTACSRVMKFLITFFTVIFPSSLLSS